MICRVRGTRAVGVAAVALALCAASATPATAVDCVEIDGVEVCVDTEPGAAPVVTDDCVDVGGRGVCVRGGGDEGTSTSVVVGLLLVVLGAGALGGFLLGRRRSPSARTAASPPNLPQGFSPGDAVGVVAPQPRSTPLLVPASGSIVPPSDGRPPVPADDMAAPSTGGEEHPALGTGGESMAARDRLVGGLVEVAGRLRSEALADRVWQALVRVGAVDGMEQGERFGPAALWRDEVGRRARAERETLVAAAVGLDEYLDGADRDAVRAVLASVGVVAVEPTSGAPYDPEHHVAVDHELTADPALHRRIARVERAGFVDGAKMLRDAEVIVYRHDG